MKTITALLSLIFLAFLFQQASGQYAIKKDLQSEWKTFEQENYYPFDGGTTSTIYFSLRNPDPSGEYLQIRSIEPFTLFINNKLAGQSRSMNLNLDSLAKVFSASTLHVAIHQPGISLDRTQTFLSSKLKRSGETLWLEPREPTFFRDFAIIGMLFLTIMVIVIVRLNPKLASDYFSFPRIVSLREADDSQLYTRIGNSTNILFYVYCSLLLGYYFIVIFHFVSQTYPITLYFSASSFGGLVVQWLKLSGIILLLCILKIVIVYSLSYMFGISQVAGIHFFNWVRLIVVVFGILTIGLFLYVLWHGYDQTTHETLFRLVAWIVGGWIVLIFLKLGGKASASLFHLFSYICATEVIPFLFIIKVLYN